MTRYVGMTCLDISIRFGQNIKKSKSLCATNYIQTIPKAVIVMGIVSVFTLSEIMMPPATSIMFPTRDITD